MTHINANDVCKCKSQEGWRPQIIMILDDCGSVNTMDALTVGNAGNALNIWINVWGASDYF